MRPDLSRHPSFIRACAWYLAVAASLLLAIAPAFAGQGDRTMTGADRLVSAFKAMRGADLDPTRSVAVENLVIQKDATRIVLESGTIWFTRPWREGARPTGGWFSGRGRLRMTPPIQIERDALERALGKSSLDETFTEAWIWATDDFHDLLKDRLAPSSSGGAEAARAFRERCKVHEDLNFDFELSVIQDLETASSKQPAFLFEFEMPKKGWVAFFYSSAGLPGALLGETMYFRPAKVNIFEGESTILTAFHDKADYESGRDLGHEDRDQIRIRHCRGDITVEKDSMRLLPRLDVEIEAQVDGLKAMSLALLSYYQDESHPFRIDSLTDASGKPLEHLHRNHQLLVVLPQPLAKGDRTVLHFEYSADYIRPNPPIGVAFDDTGIAADALSMVKAKISALTQNDATFTLLNTYPWFPTSGYLKRHTFDWTIRVPAPYIAIASGTTLRRWAEDGYNCLHSSETVPVILASILFGRYVEKADTSAKPAIRVFTLGLQQKQAADLLAEARTIVTEYEKWLGPFPFDELDVAQMGFFYGFGQAPPGLVQLTGEAFLSGAEITDIVGMLSGRVPDTSFVHWFYAHEIGHEWWGHAVSWANINDQWLSESYTEYCSALYVQSTIGQKAFDAKLQQWRDRAARSKDAGPIWLGQRLGKHYINQTYQKGPYVVHMLRLALQAQAVSTGGTVADGDATFFAILRNFMDRFRNQNPTTLDLQKVVKETSKVDMDWFFDQWFRGNNWLNLEFRYEVRPTEDGKHLLTATFRQPDAKNIKQAVVPMYIHMDKDTVITRPIFVRKAEQTVQIKLPSPPQKVTVDDHKDVLVDVKSF